MKMYAMYGAVFLASVAVVGTGISFLNATIGSETYVASRSLNASAIVTESAPQFKQSTETEDTSLVEESLDENAEEELPILEEDLDVDSMEVIAEEEPEEDTSVASDYIETLQETVEALAQQVNAQQTSAEETVEPEYFTTPSGVKIDADGNVVKDDGSVEEVDTEDSEPVEVPDGVFVTPSGAWIDEYGNIVSQGDTTSNDDNEEEKIPAGFFRTPSGAIVDQNGNVFKMADGSSGTTQTTTYSTTSPPAIGSSVSIPKSLTFSVDLNSGKTCEELGKKGQQLVLCELYKYHYDDYTWIKLDT